METIFRTIDTKREIKRSLKNFNFLNNLEYVKEMLNKYKPNSTLKKLFFLIFFEYHTLLCELSKIQDIYQIRL